MPSVNDLSKRLTAREIAEWEEFEKLEPFGSLHEDYRFATVTQMLYDANRNHDKTPDRQLDSFRVTYQEPPTPEQVRQEAQIKLEKFKRLAGPNVTRLRRIK